jgi:hypothetical protein
VVLVLLGDLWPWAAHIAAWFAKLFANSSVWCVQRFEAAPLGLIYWSQPGVYGVINYFLVLAAVVASRYWYRWFKPAAFYVLLIAVIFLATLAVSRPAPPVEVMFFDVRWQSLIGIKLPGGIPRLVGTTGAFSQANRHWVIEPFLMHANWPRNNIEYDAIPRQPGLSEVELPYTSVPDAVIDSPQLEGIKQLQFFCRSGADSLLLAEYLAVGQDNILILYHHGPGLLNYLRSRFKSGWVNILAMPSSPPSARLIEAMAGLDFGTLLVFGAPPRRFSRGIGEVWARHFPGHPVFATCSHGGIRILLSHPPQIITTVR